MVNKMIQTATLPVLFAIVFSGFIFFENKPVVVENQQVTLSYHLNGGILKSFSLKENSFNPFQTSKDSLESYGHVLSLGSSRLLMKDEIAMARNLTWELQNSPIQKGKNMEMMLRGDFLNEKLTVKRWVTLPLSGSFVEVKEEVFNYSDSSVTIDFSQILTLNPAFNRDTEIFSNLDVKSDAKINFRKTNDAGDLKWFILYNQPNSVLYGFVFQNNSYSNIHLGNGNSPFLRFSGEGESVTIGGKSMVSKGYCSFLQIVSKTFKEVNKFELRGNQLYLLGNSNQQIVLGTIKGT
jgi:hypothetical protein